jgi:hypothetical protein
MWLLVLGKAKVNVVVHLIILQFTSYKGHACVAFPFGAKHQAC